MMHGASSRLDQVANLLEMVNTYSSGHTDSLLVPHDFTTRQKLDGERVHSTKADIRHQCMLYTCYAAHADNIM